MKYDEIFCINFLVAQYIELLFSQRYTYFFLVRYQHSDQNSGGTSPNPNEGNFDKFSYPVLKERRFRFSDYFDFALQQLAMNIGQLQCYSLQKSVLCFLVRSNLVLSACCFLFLIFNILT